jgi:hypothetical protein
MLNAVRQNRDGAKRRRDQRKHCDHQQQKPSRYLNRSCHHRVVILLREDRLDQAVRITPCADVAIAGCWLRWSTPSAADRDLRRSLQLPSLPLAGLRRQRPSDLPALCTNLRIVKAIHPGPWLSDVRAQGGSGRTLQTGGSRTFCKIMLAARRERDRLRHDPGT